MTKYEDYDWKELPKDAQAAATALGYTKKMWDADKEPKAADKEWKELSEDEKKAATVLGYTEEAWDADSDSD
eukprot:CAMPEP_0172549846 /NCGR_PEP_ID=MMETSP1067-20121228/22118_1 /TAXON_ID=265564 ORGANISM="Thalassiosira punctigera, Strain Tpunct2005C2" /NCGR_SAMPLE_ID=MMETSP1067 /ASSEMBLY_ACC=CAM_ASM_000444 /LENGTH=71 /DNA_ID=CAMNT_0013337275 /DNA_START=138 /DNA_END=353 /DNA_ORIENTATION=+